MKKINLILIMALFLIISSISVIAWVNCTPSACDSGYNNSGIYCIGSTCYRNCTGLTCTGGSWTQVYSDEITYGGTTADEDDTSGTYTASNSSACYKFTFEGSGDDFWLDVDDTSYDPVGSATNCDGEAIAGFWESGKPSNPWYENLTDSGTWGSNYWGDMNYSTFDYFFIAVRSHTQTDSFEDPSYDDPMEVNYAIYCAPTAEGCEAVANYSINCDIGCYNKGTYIYNYQGHQEDYTESDTWWGNDESLRKNGECPDDNVGSNYFNVPYYKVYTSPTSSINKDPSCERTNEVPTAFGVNVIPINAVAGEDLICNYTYTDPEDFEEKESTYEWWKNNVNQNINSQILGKGNLTVNDEWYCKVTPSDGLLNGTQQQSSNTAVILTTVQNVKLYVEDEFSWSSDGYFDEANVLDFSAQINNALDDCQEDAEGYCNISLTFSSDSNGTLNVSDIGIYYQESELIVLPQDPNKLFIKNSTGTNITWFGDLGNVVTKGSLEQNTNRTLVSTDLFAFQDSNNNNLMIVDNAGNIYIKGNLLENQDNLNYPTGCDCFVIVNETDSTVAYVNESGYLFLEGRLYENSNP